jgi:hypothetical protein
VFCGFAVTHEHFERVALSARINGVGVDLLFYPYLTNIDVVVENLRPILRVCSEALNGAPQSECLVDMVLGSLLKSSSHATTDTCLRGSWGHPSSSS